MTENLIARNVREQLWLVNTRCETGRRHQGNGDDKLAAIDTLGCYFGEGAGIENVGRKISRDKGYSRKHTLGRRGDEDKEKAKRGERSRDDYYSTIAYKDYIFHPFVVIKSVLFPSNSHYLCHVYTKIVAGTEIVNIDACVYISKSK